MSCEQNARGPGRKRNFPPTPSPLAPPSLAKLQPGTILYRTWGYEQTNCDFYQVVRLLSKTIEVRKIGHATTETGFMQGYATPCKDHFIGPVQRVGPDKYSVLDRPSVGVSWYG